MKKLILLCSLLLIITASASNLKAQDQEMMKRWMEYSTPSDAHKAMAKLAGNWNFTSKMWMDPSQPPMDGTGTNKFEMIYGDRYLQSKVSSTMMGMPFEGVSILGYDNAKKIFQSTPYNNCCFVGYDRDNKAQYCSMIYRNPFLSDT